MDSKLFLGLVGYFVLCFSFFWIFLLVKTFFFPFFRGFIQSMGKKEVFYFLGGMFSLIFFSKIFGLVPFFFSFTSMTPIVLFFGLLTWGAMVFSGVSGDFVGFFSHFTPSGAPVPLVPLLKVVELMSNFIRPLTLSLRLSINMTSGHVFLALLASFFFLGKGFWGGLVLMVFSVVYKILEVFVCLIQAFVFVLLCNQYKEEK